MKKLICALLLATCFWFHMFKEMIYGCSLGIAICLIIDWVRTKHLL